MNIAIIGAGWAGLTAAIRATQDGHRVTLLEAARTLGGRARTVDIYSHAHHHVLDNGQHILIGAYTETLRLMRLVGIDPQAVLVQSPLSLTFPDGTGLQLPDWPSPWDVVAGIARAKGWTVGDKLSLLRTALGWQYKGFQCKPEDTVALICSALSAPVFDTFIEPLCVSALNTPASRASGQVFLRVLQDALFGVKGGSKLLLPRVPLGQLFPEAAGAWLTAHGCTLRLGARVHRLQPLGKGWTVDGALFDHVILATSSTESLRVLMESAPAAPENTAHRLYGWANTARELRFEAITTVYAQSPSALPQAMLALRSNAACPAQFVFDRGQLGDTSGDASGLLAFVISASTGDRASLEAQVVAQAQAQLGLTVTPVQTITEKRATFACTPALDRPPQHIAPALSACGDYVAGPYPATLEGAVRSGWAAGLVRAKKLNSTQLN
jgi:hydroxysqualene dehydroxylase